MPGIAEWPQILVNGLISASVITLIALGFTLIYGTVKFFHLAHGAVYTIGGYATYLFFNQHIPLLPSILLAMLICGLLGFLIETFFYRPLRNKNVHGLIYLIASMGLLILLQGIVSILFGGEIRSLVINPEVEAGLEFIGAIITKGQILIVISAIVLTVLLLIFVKTSLGREMRAFSDNKFLAEAIGIDTDKILVFTFIIGSALAGAAGGLISLEKPLYPSMGFSALLYGVLACIVGGIGSIPGTIIGAILLGMVESVGVTYIASEWKDTIALAVLITILVIKPRGILGKT